MERVWPGMTVEEGNLTVQVAALRKALGQRADNSDWIVTVARIGYRLWTEDAERRGKPSSPLPSLAVLPFHNLSGDAAQDYFADGIVDDLITALSRFKTFAVISRNSSFVYKGRAVDVREIGRELGVRYVLEGSIRRSGNRLRVTAQLVDAATAGHLWAQNYDGALEDVFDDAGPHYRERRLDRRADGQAGRDRTHPAQAADQSRCLRSLPRGHGAGPDDRTRRHHARHRADRALAGARPRLPAGDCHGGDRIHVVLRPASAGRDRANAAQGSRVCPGSAGRRRRRRQYAGDRRNRRSSCSGRVRFRHGRDPPGDRREPQQHQRARLCRGRRVLGERDSRRPSATF